MFTRHRSPPPSPSPPSPPAQSLRPPPPTPPQRTDAPHAGACENCRNSHLKCDGNCPCSRCCEKQNVCTYLQPLRPPTPPQRTDAPHAVFPISLKVVSLPDTSLATTNKAYVHPTILEAMFPGASDPASKKSCHVIFKDKYVLAVEGHAKLAPLDFGVGLAHRRWASLTLSTEIEVSPFLPARMLETLTFNVDLARGGSSIPHVFDGEELLKSIHSLFDRQALSDEQLIYLDFAGAPLFLTTNQLTFVNLNSEIDSNPALTCSFPCGVLTPNTMITLQKAPGSQITIKNAGAGNRATIFKNDLNVEQMGIGGLNDQFMTILRRAFASRVCSAAFVNQLGVKHVRGILLYGPPGTGKTLLARQIGKMLNSHEPKIVSGPEILSKFVGESEKNMRELFADAEAEYTEKGDESDLHLIIFDEIDAICKTRGSFGTGSGVGDSVLNQLLAKLDGVNSLNNILVIGMTNRKDMIDSALLRPGRLEVHVEIGLPDQAGRLQILNIHTRKIKTSGHLASDVNISQIASLTPNYTGAELEGVVKAATSHAIFRKTDFKNFGKGVETNEDTQVSMDDFLLAVNEITPILGVDREFLSKATPYGILHHPSHDQLLSFVVPLMQSLGKLDLNQTRAILLEGEHGVGKTSIAVDLARNSGFPFVKFLSPKDFEKMSTESAKVTMVCNIFEDVYKSPLSVVVLDDFEEIIELSTGPRFSNSLLHCLLTYMTSAPPRTGSRLLTITTTSCYDQLVEYGMIDRRFKKIHVPALSTVDDVETVIANFEEKFKSNLIPTGDIRSLSQTILQLGGPLLLKPLLEILGDCSKTVMAEQEDPIELFLSRFKSSLSDVSANSKIENSLPNPLRSVEEPGDDHDSIKIPDS
nr:vesicular-fusion protein SEC18 [Paratrimastix eleionoma]